MTSPWFSRVKLLVPPILPAVVRRFRTPSAEAIRFTGDYPTWQAAQAASDGYDDAAILERVRSSTALARDGKVAFERDGVTFDEPDYNFPLLACLLRIASENGNRLRVLDFGGALGSTYFQCRGFFGGLTELRWTVVEQAHYVVCGQREFENGQLRFRTTISEATADGSVDLVLTSNALQYLADPDAYVSELAMCGAKWLIVDRFPSIALDRDILTVQYVPPAIFGKSVLIPSRFFGEKRLDQMVGDRSLRLLDFPNPEGSVALTGGIVARFASSMWKIGSASAGTV